MGELQIRVRKDKIYILKIMCVQYQYSRYRMIFSCYLFYLFIYSLLTTKTLCGYRRR